MRMDILGFVGLGLVLAVGLGIAKFSGGGTSAVPEIAEPAYPPVEVGQLLISDYWVAESIGAQRTTAAYMTITSNAATDDRLVEARADFAGMTSLHRTVTEDGTSRMEGLTGIILPAGGSVSLMPGGMHVMLMGLQDTVAADTEAEITLVFLEAGEVTLTAPVRSRMEMMDHSEH